MVRTENTKTVRGLANLASLANSTLEKARQTAGQGSEVVHEYLEERAAIQEYDGGLTREQAEAEAQRALRAYEYRLSDNPGGWLVMIVPGCDMDTAAKTCRNMFGADRVLEVREYNRSSQPSRGVA